MCYVKVFVLENNIDKPSSNPEQSSLQQNFFSLCTTTNIGE